MQPVKKKFIHPNRDQILLLPPELNEWVTKDHFARFLVGVLEKLDFGAFYASYLGVDTETAGRPPFSPDLMVGLIFYALTKGALSSRAIEDLAYSDVGARYLTGNIQPDHACIARFRGRHGEAIEGLFSQIVLLCHQAGLVSLHNVALDSTPCAANVAGNSHIRVDDLEASWGRSKARAKDLMEKLEVADKEDEALQKRLKRQAKEAHGKASRIEQALEFLKNQVSDEPSTGEPEADETEDSEASSKMTRTEWSAKARSKIGDRVRGARLCQGLSCKDLAHLIGCDPKRLAAVERGERSPRRELHEGLVVALGIDASDLMVPKKPSTSRRKKVPRINITDRDCYLTYKPYQGYEKGYLGQVAADSVHQIVIDAHVSKTNSDQEYPATFTANCQDRFGRLPETLTSDTNYTSVANIEHMESLGIDYFTAVSPKTGKSITSSPVIIEMRKKLEGLEGKSIYNTRSGVVEPVFSRLESQLGFTRFLYRGFEKVRCEWIQMQTAYNLLRWFTIVARQKV